MEPTIQQLKGTLFAKYGYWYVWYFGRVESVESEIICVHMCGSFECDY